MQLIQVQPRVYQGDVADRLGDQHGTRGLTATTPIRPAEGS
jgi:hypothetical protein